MEPGKEPLLETLRKESETETHQMVNCIMGCGVLILAALVVVCTTAYFLYR